MIEHIFFSCKETIEEVSKLVFCKLGIEDSVSEGDSVNVKEGVYFSCSVFGVKIKLEYNSYDYDDTYNYMLGIRKDYLASITVRDESIADVTKIICLLLVDNLETEIAYEQADNTLKVLT